MNKTVRTEKLDLHFGDPHDFPNVEYLEKKYSNKSPSKSAPENVERDSSELVESHQREAKLVQLIDDKNKKIEQLCVLLEALEPAPGMDPEKYRRMIESGNDGVDFRDSKIVSLAKKSQNLTMLLNKERATSENLSMQLKELRLKYDNLSQQISTPSKSNAPEFGPKLSAMGGSMVNSSDMSSGVDEAAPRRMAGLTKELRDANKQVEELKAKLLQVSEDNKALTRALSQELGDGVSLEHAVDGGWRGRAQQIVMLKSKVSQ
jgi:hypothetical protein